MGGVAGVAAISGVTSATDSEPVRTIDVDTSGHPRVNNAEVRIFEDGAIEQRLSGHQPQGAAAGAVSIEMENTSLPEQAQAQLVKRQATGKPDSAGTDSGKEMTKDGGQDDIGTMDHSGSNDESDYQAYLKMVCEKGDRCGCLPEYEVYNFQEADWNDDDGDGCVSDPENFWRSGWAINGSACNNWNHEEKQQWEDDGTCSLDQIREDRFSYGGGSNEIVMRQQMTLHADGSTSWEVLRYDDGGNGCLFHGLEFQ